MSNLPKAQLTDCFFSVLRLLWSCRNENVHNRVIRSYTTVSVTFTSQSELNCIQILKIKTAQKHGRHGLQLASHLFLSSHCEVCMLSLQIEPYPWACLDIHAAFASHIGLVINFPHLHPYPPDQSEPRTQQQVPHSTVLDLRFQKVVLYYTSLDIYKCPQAELFSPEFFLCRCLIFVWKHVLKL